MPLLVNLRHLEEKNLLLEGELPVSELQLDGLDELIHLGPPLAYDLEVEMLDNGVLAQGTLDLALECECARCLKPYPHRLLLEDWACLLPLEGEEPAPILDDCVDLTPYIREDIVLALPQHPLCNPECAGLKSPEKDLQAEQKPQAASAAWAELNKLKLKE